LLDWTNKIVGVVAGCYCPAHRGHYESIVYLIQKFKLNVIIIMIFGHAKPENSRHGVPESESVKAWKSWGKIIEKKYRCTVVVVKNDYNLRFVPNTVRYVFLVQISETEKQQEEKKYSSLFLPNVDRNIISRQIILRNRNNLSATNFTQCLMNVNDNCLRFVPFDISRKERLDYITRLRKKYKRYFH
jgi:hypothetical protein